MALLIPDVLLRLEREKVENSIFMEQVEECSQQIEKIGVNKALLDLFSVFPDPNVPREVELANLFKKAIHTSFKNKKSCHVFNFNVERFCGLVSMVTLPGVPPEKIRAHAYALFRAMKRAKGNSHIVTLPVEGGMVLKIYLTLISPNFTDFEVDVLLKEA